MFGPLNRPFSARLIAAAVVAACIACDRSPAVAPANRYEDLLSLFTDWRAFQKPKLTDGVPRLYRERDGCPVPRAGGVQRRLRRSTLRAGPSINRWTGTSSGPR